MLDVSSFKDLVSKLCRRIKENRELYEKNEAAVRRQLIEPVLEFLGWDTSDPSQVVPEDKTEEGKADYCLLLDDGSRGLFVEAKNMSKDADNGLNDIMRHCADQGVGYGVSTTGEKWLLFRAFEEGKKREERKLWRIDICKDPVEKVFAKLTQISRENLPELDRRVRQEDSVAGLIDRCLQNLSPQIVSGICDAVRNEPEFSNLSCEDDELKNIVRGKLSSIVQGTASLPIEEEEPKYQERPTYMKRTGKGPRQTPKAMVLFGTKIPSLRTSREILINVAQELTKRGKVSTRNVPFASGPSRYLMYTRPRHPSGKDFIAPEKLQGGLWIETHFSTKDTIKYARRLLEHCGCKASDLQIIE